jgi:hypothetical protein
MYTTPTPRRLVRGEMRKLEKKNKDIVYIVKIQEAEGEERI